MATVGFSAAGMAKEPVSDGRKSGDMRLHLVDLQLEHAMALRTSPSDHPRFGRLGSEHAAGDNLVGAGGVERAGRIVNKREAQERLHVDIMRHGVERIGKKISRSILASAIMAPIC